MIAGWIDRALQEGARFDLATTHGRERMVELLLDAIPKRLIVACVFDSCSSALRVRNIRDDAGDISSHIANNATQSILTALEVEP